MTEQHPLTDEICKDISSCITEPDPYLCQKYITVDMRAAADWQLEEVMRKVELKLNEWRIQGYVAGADACVLLVVDLG